MVENNKSGSCGYPLLEPCLKVGDANDAERGGKQERKIIWALSLYQASTLGGYPQTTVTSAYYDKLPNKQWHDFIVTFSKFLKINPNTLY